MRLCVPIPCFFPKMDFADALRRVKALGFDAAEGYDWRGFDFAAVRRALDETGVELLSRPILEDSGVTLMIEPLNTLVNHPGYYLWSSVEGFDILLEVGHPLVKMVYDIYHQQVMEGNIIPNVVNHLNLIAHLHAAGHPGRRELQLGENDYHFIFHAIDQAGYTGACGLEYYPTLPAEECLIIARALYAQA